MSILTDLSKNIINLPRYTKRIIAILIDIGICIICTWLAFYLRLEEFVKINNVTTLAVEISILIAIPIFWLMGLYKTIFRFQGSSIIFTVFIATSVYALLYFAVIRYLWHSRHSKIYWYYSAYFIIFINFVIKNIY